ncbi:MAG TPA: response regulator [Bacteroidia bacterium]|jgi:CheY-like chemotaxis protein
MGKNTIVLSKAPKGSFVFIDDSDQEFILLKEAMEELGLKNKLRHFNNGQEAFLFLKRTKEAIFLILSDVNMPAMDGLQLKRLIDLTPEIKIKAIPFIFHSQSASPAEVRAAYSCNIQGYVQKASNLEGTVESLYRIVAMWTNCIHPRDL